MGRSVVTSAGLCAVGIVIAGCGGEASDGDELFAPDEETTTAAFKATATCSIAINAERELMVRHGSVVNDPVRTVIPPPGSGDDSYGVWHFGTLMTNLAGSQNPSTFVRSWLGQWETDRIVNGVLVPKRPGIATVIASWPKLASGKLNLAKAPFRLLAIVNRTDLRKPQEGHAGEVRMVYGLLDGAGNPLPFTVIFEYRQLINMIFNAKPLEVKAELWAKYWHDASPPGATFPSDAINGAIARITNHAVIQGLQPGAPHGSALARLGTNDAHLGAPQLRQFHLNGSGQLVMTPLDRTPHAASNGTAALRDFINQNAPAILADTHTVPLQFQGKPFQGGAAPGGAAQFWKAPGVTNNQARHLLSLNTCNGCHGREANANLFHVAPRAKSAVSVLSKFLIGTTVVDPVSGISRTFHELARRAAEMKKILCSPAGQACLANESTCGQ